MHCEEQDRPWQSRVGRGIVERRREPEDRSGTSNQSTMSDEQLPTRAEMASAYLDGELHADGRATVEVDPEAMALVDSFAGVRAELQAREPVDDLTRSAAVTAALADF